eukprot:CAMPEP_0119037638 /NCGR_PEP_ID=MMETSP1177-20130426/6124_1 /TAXON_ID=2985 /ORGANISM="Ochromonas sp, Strain CCMP1899" /LENGTH=760 /DNA_ID=CAMNT_0006999199 /DNA_START=123 /DNA_END=2402 /DNA_ORIENTATION=-
MTFIEKIEYGWKQMPNNNKKVPSVRCNMSGGMYNDHLWLLMGAGAGTGRSSEVWKYSMKNNNWSLVVCTGDSPTPRDGHSATYIGNGKFLLFGGQGVPSKNIRTVRFGEKTQTLVAREVFNDVYEFDCELQTWTALLPTGGSPPPTSRRLHSANFLCYQEEVEKIEPDEKSVAPLGRSSRINKTSFAMTETRKYIPVIQNSAPNNSILIYGGCGIEPSKKSEQVFNDLWAYVCETNTWSTLSTRGAIPRPQSGHKSELIGDILVIVGGVAATPFSLSKNDLNLTSALSKMTSDVMTLNVRTLTWSYLDTRDPMGRNIKLNLHGHSIAAERSDGRPSTSIFIFGGKDAVEAIQSDMKRSSLNRYFWRLDITTGVVNPILTKDLPPENRYGHMGLTVCSTVLPKTVNMDTRPRSAGSFRTEPIMIVYGGSSLDAGGFVEPEVFTFMRSFRVDINDDTSVNTLNETDNSTVKTGSTRQSLSSGHRRGSGEENTQMSPAQMMEYDDGMQMEDLGLTNNNRNQQKTIWQRVHDKGNSSLSGISVKSIKQPSGSWKDIKLALSYPQTERNSLIPSTASVIYPNNTGKKDKSSVPDAIRIAEMLAKEITEMEINSNAFKSSRQSRAANLLIGENEHNLQNCNDNSIKNGTDTYSSKHIRMMRTLETGRGTKSLLGLETQNLEESKIRFKNLGLQSTQVEQLLNNQERKDKISKTKLSSHALLPVVRGLRKSEAKQAYNTMYPLEDIDDYNQQTNIVLSQALSLNYSD